MNPLRTLRWHGATWPSLRITLHVFPWNWQVTGYVDNDPGSMDEPLSEDRVAGWLGLHVQIGPLEIDYGHNRPAFTWEKPTEVRS